MRVLILGGTTEASALARALHPEHEVVLSFAGRTRAPVLPGVPCRIGGFGGVAGLVGYLREHGVEVLVDATHPFAAVMSANAVRAAAIAGVPRLAVVRPAWRRGRGDRWTEVADMRAAAAAIGGVPRRVFLTVGQLELAPFRAAPQHDYLLRSIDRPDAAALPPRCRCITGRGPFDEAGERLLLADRDVLVTKNSGAVATEAKLGAARALGLPVIMVGRPASPAPPHVASVEAALEWVRDHGKAGGALRGV